MLNKISLCAFTLVLTISISNAHVKLDNPNGGETFKPGSEITIKWSVSIDHGDNNWDLFYSVNGGDVWQEIEVDIDKSILEFVWKFPITETSRARIKVIQDNTDYPNYEDESANFSISNNTSPIEPEPESEVITAIDNMDLDSNEEIILSNFPNPFNSHTTIQFSLLKKSHVSLGIYNLQGRLVSELINTPQVKGSYEIVWENHGFLKGIYICRLQVNDIHHSRKIMINP